VTPDACVLIFDARYSCYLILSYYPKICRLSQQYFKASEEYILKHSTLQKTQMNFLETARLKKNSYRLGSFFAIAIFSCVLKA
jgi:hypothetical protein